MRGRAFVGMLLLAVASPALADDAPICADRPGKATSTCTVPAGRWQLETGFADWSLDRSAGERDTSLVIGETFIKFGLTDRSDIGVDLVPWQRVTSRSAGFHDSASGFGDLRFVYKQELTADDASLQLSISPFVKIPTAKRPLGNRKLEAGLLFPIGYSIPNSPLSIGLTPEIDWVADGDGHGHHAAMTQVASLAWQVSPRFNVSGEVWGQWDWDPAGTTKQVSADGSIAWLARNDIQLDAGANFGLNRQTADVELYVGVSKRF
ncbi:MAG TPA: transporter [Sphingomicrobium sp.]|nr:transporter [Sphingomicrobium sp.]